MTRRRVWMITEPVSVPVIMALMRASMMTNATTPMTVVTSPLILIILTILVGVDSPPKYKIAKDAVVVNPYR